MTPTFWPSSLDYTESILNPGQCLVDSELKICRPSLNKFGTPFVWSGQFACVFKMQSGYKTYAVRCFTSKIGDQQERYAAISQALNHVNKPACMLDFEYIQNGIRVNNNWYPIVKMKWSDGQYLDNYIESLVATHNKAGFYNLAEIWLSVINDLHQSKIAHNDLQHENILITNYQIQLVDYDGCFVPALSGYKALELGVPHYQHPLRNSTDFNLNIDNFSALVIYLSLRALAVKPELWTRLHKDRRLIFGADDYRNPMGSNAIQELLNSTDNVVRQLTQDLVNACLGPISAVPTLGTLVANIQNSLSLPPNLPSSVSVKSSTPPPLTILPPPLPPSRPSTSSKTIDWQQVVVHLFTLLGVVITIIILISIFLLFRQ